MSDYSKLTARDALELLPGDLAIPKGALRIHAYFHHGRVHGEVKVRAIRVPPFLTEVIANHRRAHFDLNLLEHAARELNLTSGNTELIVEYIADKDGKMTVHWIDFEWSERAA